MVYLVYTTFIIVDLLSMKYFMLKFAISDMDGISDRSSPTRNLEQ